MSNVDWDALFKKVKLEDNEVEEIKPILKPCPFCGRRPSKVRKYDEYYRVECKGKSSNCFIRPKTGLYETEEAAIEAWNRRADG